MFKFDISKNVPRFILNDKNGCAIAKALEAGLQKMNDIIEEGLSCVSDPEVMPEWRLDEMAWETNCLYDYSAEIAVKRLWIENALPLYRLHGTPDAIREYLGNYFDDVNVEENWEYSGEPYHFRITVDGEWAPELNAWAMKAIESGKNVRSVLDSTRLGNLAHIGITAEGEQVCSIQYPLTNTLITGEWP